MRSPTGLFLLLIVLLVWAPIPIGSNRPWSQGLLAASALSMGALWACMYGLSPFAMPKAVRALGVVGGLLGAWALYPILQLLPLPAALISVVGGPLNGVDLTVDSLGAASLTSLSVDRNATFGGFLMQTSLVCLFFLTVALTTSYQRLKLLLLVMAGVGFVEAFYGLILYFSGGGMGLWDPGHMPTTVSGTYVNQNHFAGLMEMTIPAVIGLGLAEGKMRRNRQSIAGIARGVTDFMLSRRAILAFALAIMMPALFMTTSRGAVVALSVAVTGAFLLAMRQWKISSNALRVGLVLSGLLLTSLLWLGTGGFFDKVHKAGFESNRGDLREISYQMIGDNLIAGTGVGTYRWTFPAYKDERFGSGFYEHAHNDFLEILGEQGVLGFALVFGAIGLILFRATRAFLRRQNAIVHGALFASLVGCSSLLIHGLVDFNLQIPANASYFFVLLGIGFVASTIDAPTAND